MNLITTSYSLQLGLLLSHFKSGYTTGWYMTQEQFLERFLIEGVEVVLKDQLIVPTGWRGCQLTPLMVASPIEGDISRAPGDLACLACPDLVSPGRRYDGLWYPPPEETLRRPRGAAGVGLPSGSTDGNNGFSDSDPTRILAEGETGVGLFSVGDSNGSSGSWSRRSPGEKSIIA